MPRRHRLLARRRSRTRTPRRHHRERRICTLRRRHLLPRRRLRNRRRSCNSAVPPSTSNAVVITNLDNEAVITLQSAADHPSPGGGGTIGADAIGLLYFTTNQRPQEGIALTTIPYHTLATFHCLVDCGSELNIINWQDAQTVLGDVD